MLSKSEYAAYLVGYATGRISDGHPAASALGVIHAKEYDEPSTLQDAGRELAELHGNEPDASEADVLLEKCAALREQIGEMQKTIDAARLAIGAKLEDDLAAAIHVEKARVRATISGALARLDAKPAEMLWNACDRVRKELDAALDGKHQAQALIGRVWDALSPDPDVARGDLVKTAAAARGEIDRLERKSDAAHSRMRDCEITIEKIREIACAAFEETTEEAVTRLADVARGDFARDLSARSPASTSPWPALSAEDAATLRGAGWIEGDRFWEKPSGPRYMLNPTNLESLRLIAVDLRSEARRADVATVHAMGDALAGDVVRAEVARVLGALAQRFHVRAADERAQARGWADLSRHVGAAEAWEAAAAELRKVAEEPAERGDEGPGRSAGPAPAGPDSVASAGAEGQAPTWDREALGREVHGVYMAWTRSALSQTWEMLGEKAREHDRMVGERLFSLGLAEGERRGKAKAEELVKRWESVMSRARADKNVAKANAVLLCMTNVRYAFGVCGAPDPSPPTGGEPESDYESGTVRADVNAFAKSVVSEAKQRGIINNDQMHEIAGIIDRRLWPENYGGAQPAQAAPPDGTAPETEEKRGVRINLNQVWMMGDVGSGPEGIARAFRECLYGSAPETGEGDAKTHVDVMASVSDRAYADGIVEGLTRARDVARRLADRDRLGAIDAHEVIDEIDKAVSLAITFVAPGDLQPQGAARAALVALVERWEESADLDRRVRRGLGLKPGSLSTESARLEARAKILDRCAGGLRRLLDAPRGSVGVDVEAAPERPEDASVRRDIERCERPTINDRRAALGYPPIAGGDMTPEEHVATADVKPPHNADSGALGEARASAHSLARVIGAASLGTVLEHVDVPDSKQDALEAALRNVALANIEAVEAPRFVAGPVDIIGDPTPRGAYVVGPVDYGAAPERAGEPTMRIERRADGCECLVGAPNGGTGYGGNGCGQEHTEPPFYGCTYHFAGEHIATFPVSGVEEICARWPIAQERAQDNGVACATHGGRLSEPKGPAKPASVDVGQRWRCVGVEDSAPLVVAELRPSLPGFSGDVGLRRADAAGPATVRAREADMLALDAWTFLGGPDGGADERWLPGALWERSDGAVRTRLSLSEVAHGRAWLAAGPHGSLEASLRRSDMTEANGWRYVGRPREPGDFLDGMRPEGGT